MHKSIILFLKPYKYLVISGFAVVSIIALLIITPRPCYNDGFRNLSELQEYAKTIDEFIKMENDNYNLPTYESYYQKNFGPSVWKTIQEKLTWLLCSIGLKKKPPFSPCFFKTLLEKVTDYRKAKGWNGAFIQKIEIKETSKAVVFGPVQGAFHGIVRYLEELNKLEIIDENLKIKNPDYYFIFLGNIVNRSPYTLEIFSIILKLLEQNPKNVIYLKGTNEFPDYWRQHTLHRELEIRAHTLSSSKIPLEHEVDSFFNTLPITLYCTIPFLSESACNYFKCAPYIDNAKLLTLLDASHYATFLRGKTQKRLSYLNLNNVQDHDPEAKNLKPRAIIRGIRKRDEYEEMDGLSLLAPTKGLPTWTVISSTAETYRVALKFFYDAFVIITPAKEIADWQITLYKRHILRDPKFSSRTEFFFKPVK